MNGWSFTRRRSTRPGESLRSLEEELWQKRRRDAEVDYLGGYPFDIPEEEARRLTPVYRPRPRPKRKKVY